MKLKWWHIALLICFAVAFISPLASSSPDGLEKVAEDKGFISEVAETPYELISDYVLPGVDNEALATILAGLIGTLVLFGAVCGLAWLIRRGREKRGEA